MAAVPFNVSAVAPVRFAPVMTTEVPTGPLVGAKLVMVGAVVTVKLVEEVAAPLGVVTETFPVVAPVGTVAVIWVALLTVNVAAVPLKERAEAPVRLVPATTTVAPSGPEEGCNPEIVGTEGVGDPEPEPVLPPPHDAITSARTTAALLLKTRLILPVPIARPLSAQLLDSVH